MKILIYYFLNCILPYTLLISSLHNPTVTLANRAKVISFYAPNKSIFVSYLFSRLIFSLAKPTEIRKLFLHRFYHLVTCVIKHIPYIHPTELLWNRPLIESKASPKCSVERYLSHSGEMFPEHTDRVECSSPGKTQINIQKVSVTFAENFHIIIKLHWDTVMIVV